MRSSIPATSSSTRWGQSSTSIRSRRSPPNSGLAKCSSLEFRACATASCRAGIGSARIASGKEVRPRIVRFRGDLELPTPHAPHLDLNEEYLQIARAGMNAVVNEPGGTAVRSAFDNKEWKLAGKTGTAQVYRITDEERRRGLTKGEDLPWSRRDHALFVCFAPYEAPRYACAVVVEHGIGGAKYAGPKAKEIMTAVMTKDPARLKAMTPGALAQNASRARGGESMAAVHF